MKELQQYLYRIQPIRVDMLLDATSDEQRIVAQHFDYLKELHQKEIVLLAGRTLNTDMSSFGIVTLQASPSEEAEQIMRNDPAVDQGVMKAELFPYRIALMAKN